MEVKFYLIFEPMIVHFIDVLLPTSTMLHLLNLILHTSQDGWCGINRENSSLSIPYSFFKCSASMLLKYPWEALLEVKQHCYPQMIRSEQVAHGHNAVICCVCNG